MSHYMTKHMSFNFRRHEGLTVMWTSCGLRLVLSEHLTHIILHTYFHTVVHPAISDTVILRNRKSVGIQNIKKPAGLRRIPVN